MKFAVNNALRHAGLLTSLWLVLYQLPSASVVFAVESTCVADSVTGNTPNGRLTITDLAITQDQTNCPTLREDLGKKFPAAIRKPIYIWFRLEGDRAFLSSLQTNDVFSASIHRKDDLQENTSALDLDKRRIGKSAASAEAEIYGGHFDWRFRASIVAYLVPGWYTLTVTFGGTTLCHADGSCTTSFEVQSD